jgi:hypothetical protein
MKLEGPVLGYYENGKQIIQPKGWIYTAAFILCSKCGAAISGHGGPAPGAVCVPCHDKEKE